MLIIKVSVLAAVAMSWISPTSPVTLRRNRRAGSDCLDETAHAAIETIQSACFREAATAKTKELGDSDYDATVIEENFSRLLDYYTKPVTGVLLDNNLKTQFENCVERDATNKLSMTMDQIKKKYKSTSVMRLLEKVNDRKCQGKYAEVDVLDEKFIEDKREQWSKLGIFRRAIKTVLGKIVALSNREIADCLKGIEGVKLPQLLCAIEGKEAPILEKKQCYEGVLKQSETAAKTDAAKSKAPADKPPRKLRRLGFVGKYVTDNFICANIDKQHNVKQNLKGAVKIFGQWPFATIASVVAIPIAFIVFFFLWCYGGCYDVKMTFPCYAIYGGVGGAVLGLCLLLYSVFGLPWRAIGRIFSYDENSGEANTYEDAKNAWIGQAFERWWDKGAEAKVNNEYN